MAGTILGTSLRRLSIEWKSLWVCWLLLMSLKHMINVVVVLYRHRMYLVHDFLQTLFEALHLLHQLAKDARSVELAIEEFEITLEEVMVIDRRTVAFW